MKRSKSGFSMKVYLKLGSSSLTMICLFANQIVLAQGISEMGAVYALPKPAPNRNMIDSLGHIYGANSPIPQQPLGNLSKSDEEILKASVRSYGRDANKIYQLAQKKEQSGKLSEAIKLFWTSLLLRRQAWGIEDPGAAIIVWRIANIYERLHDKAHAEEYFRLDLTMQVRNFGPGAYELCPILVKLGDLTFDQKHFSDSYSYYSRVLALNERKFGEADPKCLPIRQRLIDITMALNEWKESKQLIDQSMKVEASLGHERSQEYLHLLNCSVLVLKALGLSEQASLAEQRATTLADNLFPEKAKTLAKENQQEPNKEGQIGDAEK